VLKAEARRWACFERPRAIDRYAINRVHGDSMLASGAAAILWLTVISGVVAVLVMLANRQNDSGDRRHQ
jgi:hypothetical protein